MGELTNYAIRRRETDLAIFGIFYFNECFLIFKYGDLNVCVVCGVHPLRGLRF